MVWPEARHPWGRADPDHPDPPQPLLILLTARKAETDELSNPPQSPN